MFTEPAAPMFAKKDKVTIVSLPYGVEGMCPKKHLRKADGSNAAMDETLEFKVIEFNKDAKKIVVSHLRTFEEGEDIKPSKRSSSNSNATKNVNKNVEKSTLGDLDALANLKSEMEGKEKG